MELQREGRTTTGATQAATLDPGGASASAQGIQRNAGI